MPKIHVALETPGIELYIILSFCIHFDATYMYAYSVRNASEPFLHAHLSVLHQEPRITRDHSDLGKSSTEQYTRGVGESTD